MPPPQHSTCFARGTFRCSAHLLEQDADIRVIQVLLGHSKLDTTALYARVATKTVRAVTSPIEHLKLLMQGNSPGD